MVRSGRRVANVLFWRGIDKCKNGSNNESYILQRFSGIFIRTVLLSCSLKVEVGYNLIRDL